MSILLQAIIGAVANRIRGNDVKLWFLNQDDINALIFAGIFSRDWWHVPVLYLVMKLGSATGWSEFLAGCAGEYKLPPTADYTWISKFIKIKGQFTTFLWGCFRAFIWVSALFIGLLICGNPTPWIFTAVPMFYVTYRLAYLLTPNNKDYLKLAEPMWGAVLWGII